MAGPWLYCIAVAAKKVFDFEGRRDPIPVNSATYATLVETGRLVEGACLAAALAFPPNNPTIACR